MQSQQPNLFTSTLTFAALLYASHWIAPYQYDPEWIPYVWLIWLVTAVSVLSYVMRLLGLLPRIFSQLRPRTPKGLKGTAKWAAVKQVRKVSKNKRKGFLVGMMGRMPVWLPIESSGLVLSPAGAGLALLPMS